MSLLVLGATGTLGRQIVRRALDEGFQVKCFVRNFRKAAFLKEWGAELVYGDLKLPETIPPTLLGVTAIIDSSTARTSDLYNAARIDLYGKYILIEAAKKANIKRYIFFSILNAHKYSEVPLIQMKVIIEDYLIKSGIDYTIFNLAGFFQGLISQYALPILDNQTIWITDDIKSIAYMDAQDIAKLTVRSLSTVKTKNKILPMVGPRSWSSIEIIELCEKLSGKRSKISRIPVLILNFVRRLTNFFQWSWNISDRLAFTAILTNSDNFNTCMNEIYSLLQISEKEAEKLEDYFNEYFSKVMKKLKEINYTSTNQSNQKISKSNF
uniref:Ycf39 n=1 Tax=Gracilaria hainanensis TaxID=2871843 RepID=A0AAU7YQ45_9FLOR